MNLLFSYTRISDVVDGTVHLNGFVFTIGKRKKKTVMSYSTSASRQLYMPAYLHRMYYLWQMFSFFGAFFLLFLIMVNIMLDTNGIHMYTKCD